MSAIALVQTAAAGHADVLRTALDAGAVPDLNSGNGFSALGIASLRGHWPAVSALTAGGPRVDLRRDNGRTALLDAVQRWYASVVEQVMKAGADPGAMSVDIP